MQTVIQATNVTLDIVTRRALDSQLLRDLTRFTKDVEIATAYVSTESGDTLHCRIAVLTKDGKRLSTESSADTHLVALNQAGSQMAAALQREHMRKNDPRLNRSPRKP